MNLQQLNKNKNAGNLGKTLLFYLSAILIITVLEWMGPSGPCTPGLGFVALFAAIPVVIVLSILNLIKIVEGDRTHLISLAIHFGILLCFVLSTCAR
jgi:hypothetical protein